MRPTKSIFALFLLAIALPVWGVTVSGTVTNANGAPLHRSACGPTVGQCFVVAAYDESGRLQGSATTDSIGRYVLSLPAGDYRLLAYDELGVHATGFAGGAESYETTSPTEVRAAAVSLNFVLPRGAFISGYVLSPSGQARQDLVVAAYNLSGTRRGFTRTDATGFYFLVVPPGSYKVGTYDDRGVSALFATMFHLSARAFSEARVVHLAGPETAVQANLSTETAATISGSVFEEGTQTALPAMLVYAYTSTGGLVATGATDATGAYRLSVPPGAYRIVSADPAKVFANAFQSDAVSFDRAPLLNVARAENRSGVHFSMIRGAVITGHVTSQAGGPLPGILAAAYNRDGTLQMSDLTDANGRYELVVRTGDVVVGASDPALLLSTMFHAGSPVFRTATRLRISVGERQEGIDFALSAGGRFTGIVRNSIGQAVQGVTVAAYDAAEFLVSSAVTGADGSYTIVVPAGNYRLAAFDTQLRFAAAFAGGAPSYEVSMPATVAVGGSVTADFTVLSGVRLAGSIVSRDGSPLTGIEITAIDASGNNAGGAFSSDGTFVMMLRPGSYRFVAEDPEGLYRTIYYPSAPDPIGGAVIVVTQGQVPGELNFTLDAASRRRAVRH